MLRLGIFIVALILATNGMCLAQGFLDSVLGPGGLGIWGGDSSNLGNQQQYQQPPYQGPQTPYPSYPGAAPGYPQNPYYNQQGVYGDWQNYPPATVGGTGQEQYAPEQQYQAPQFSTQVQTVPPMHAPPQAAFQQQPPQRAPLRPGQYTPGPPPGPPQVTAEDLPAGAVRITTTTPDGTTVQFYPPSGGEAYQDPGVAAPQQPRRIRARPATAKPNEARANQAREKPSSGSTPEGGIAMPKPVEIPQNQDPRQGWGAAINRAPMAPESR